MIKVSVIMPVYNCAAYLRKCLDSVVNQTLKEIEIICVDDESTDGSYEILMEYQEKEPRMSVFRQQHKFAGAARNLGKQHAVGEYMIFWDADDFFELNTLAVLYEKAVEKNADICVCGANKFYTDVNGSAPYEVYMNKRYTLGLDVFNIKTNPDYILNFTAAVPWNKLFRRQFIEDLKLDFQEIRNGNDVFFTTNAICMAERITTVEKKLIHYRNNIGEGLVATVSKAPLTPCYAWTSTADSLKEHGVFPERSFANKACGSIMYVLRNINTRDAFVEAVTFLQKEGLEKLHLEVREPGFYFSEWYNEFIDHLTNDTPDEMLAYLAHKTYVQDLKQEAVSRVEKQRLLAEKQSLAREKQRLTEENQKLKEANKKLKQDKQKAQNELKSIKNQKLYKVLVKVRRILKKLRIR